mgnify:CR=1 FL=1
MFYITQYIVLKLDEPAVDVIYRNEYGVPGNQSQNCSSKSCNCGLPTRLVSSSLHASIIDTICYHDGFKSAKLWCAARLNAWPANFYDLYERRRRLAGVRPLELRASQLPLDESVHGSFLLDPTCHIALIIQTKQLNSNSRPAGNADVLLFGRFPLFLHSCNQ